ncbi:hypothetical protein RhiXN_07196 [Rhizoctonia solani]|uniref:Uncharacterized protein n=1 Tax=Rhizoctonia solani TaxID=456999 RepID=A0A8H8P822_9AGAM|nr:uncharacterized protein RhiXN_07196 [Rhizoctonia solani]QRW25247.1 hypothetical protein RhiXN_07196 [Rhizoctonia solani]
MDPGPVCALQIQRNTLYILESVAVNRPCHTVPSQHHTDCNANPSSLQPPKPPRGSVGVGTTDCAPLLPPRLHELARNSPSNPPSVQNIVSDSEPVHQPTEEPKPLDSDAEHAYDVDSHLKVASPLDRVSVFAAACSEEPPVAERVLKPHGGRSGDGDLPHVKILLCGDPDDYYSNADIKRFKKDCLKCSFSLYHVKGARRRNIRVCSRKGTVREQFGWFFNPEDIAPGGLLILCIIGHGDLHTEINKLQVPCTLEVVFATCSSEVIISGLDQLLVMEISETRDGALNPLSLSSQLLKGLHSPCVPKLSTKAIIVVWAAAVDRGPAYEEDNLPGREGKHDVMIGAMCRALEAAGQTLPRRMLFDKIREAAIEYNTVRDENYFSKTEVEQYYAWKSGQYRGRQRVCLLGSTGDRGIILNTPAFQAIGEGGNNVVENGQYLS